MKPNIVFLCGNTKFKKSFEKALLEESCKGNIVISASCFANVNNIRLTKKQKENLDKIDLSKIELADEIFVLNVDEYIEESTKNIINYAAKLNKSIRFFSDTIKYKF